MLIICLILICCLAGLHAAQEEHLFGPKKTPFNLFMHGCYSLHNPQAQNFFSPDATWKAVIEGHPIPLCGRDTCPWEKMNEGAEVDWPAWLIFAPLLLVLGAIHPIIPAGLIALFLLLD